MARSSNVDAVERFRFNVYVFNVGFDLSNIAKNFTGFLRAGFTEVTLPRQSTGVMEYRENVDQAHPQLIPGLTRFEPIVLRRGVTSSSDFFRWAKDTHNPSSIVSTAIQRLSGDASAAPPAQTADFRRDVLIVVYGRGGGVQTEDPTGISQRVTGVAGAASAAFGLNTLGDVKKAWLLRDAWVSSYKPGDDLSATEDTTKLVEEIELRYESFEEISLEALTSQALSLGTGIL